MTPHPAARLLTVTVLVVLLVGCSSTPNQIPTPVETTAVRVPSPGVVGESGPAEGWVGGDELDATPPMADAHPHDPPEDAQIVAAVTAAGEFVAGWLTADQQLRRERLEGVAAEALIAAFDDPRFTPAPGTQHGPAHVVEADPMQITTRHRLDTGDVVDVTLILDPDSTHGWIAIAITT